MAKKILIVEDDPRNMKLVMMTLKPHGYELLSATDGEKALEMALDNRPDLILMDLQLPKLNGLEVTRRIRKDPAMRKTPIIALTAFAMKGDEEKCFEAGCNAYVAKPINTRELPGKIAGLI
jgi:two-component system cell cycle response regulator DivK